MLSHHETSLLTIYYKNLLKTHSIDSPTHIYTHKYTHGIKLKRAYKEFNIREKLFIWIHVTTSWFRQIRTLVKQSLIACTLHKFFVSQYKYVLETFLLKLHTKTRYLYINLNCALAKNEYIYMTSSKVIK